MFHLSLILLLLTETKHIYTTYFSESISSKKKGLIGSAKLQKLFCSPTIQLMERGME
jgi:hypothetical protein